jgi:hypothetical protein
MTFSMATRRKFNQIGTKTKGATNPLSWDIPKTGLLGGIYLAIRMNVAGTLSAPNALGLASIIRRIRVITNGGIDLVNISGPQYFYLFADQIDDYRNILAGSDARSAVTTGDYNLDVFLPITLNSRDDLGLFMLQNEQTLVQLEVEFETDSVVATGATVTGTVTPAVEYFTLPLNREDWPPLNVVQQILGDERTLSAAGDHDYHWPRGNTYVSVLHGFDLATGATSDAWSRARVLINQSDTLVEYTPELLDLEVAKYRGRVRYPGTIPVDLAGTSGLGNYGSSRDMLYSARVTELLTRVTVTGAGVLSTVRRQLVALGEPAR